MCVSAASRSRQKPGCMVFRLWGWLSWRWAMWSCTCSCMTEQRRGWCGRCRCGHMAWRCYRAHRQVEVAHSLRNVRSAQADLTFFAARRMPSTPRSSSRPVWLLIVRTVDLTRLCTRPSFFAATRAGAAKQKVVEATHRCQLGLGLPLGAPASAACRWQALRLARACSTS